MSPTILLTQLLPLVAFLLVDAFVEDVRISILCAVVFAAGLLVVTWRRDRRIDWFVLLDVALIGGLGLVSILSRDELMFRLKPAILEGVAVLFLLGLGLAPETFLHGYLGRLTPAGALPAETLPRLRRLLMGMGVLVALHVVAVVACALGASRRTWALVSGPGFYLLFTPFLAVALVRFFRGRRRV